MHLPRSLAACLVGALWLATSSLAQNAATISSPRFTARVDKKTPGKAVGIDVEIAGAKRLYLVVTGSNYGWADWAEPRLSGPKGELKLTEVPWASASVGYGQPHVDANVHGDKLRIDGKPVSYGIGVHDPSLVVYDVPEGYTHFKARGGLDDGGSRGPVTFAVYIDNPILDAQTPQLWERSHTRQSTNEPNAYIETYCGDRLPGNLLPTPQSDEGLAIAEAPHFFVQPASDVNKAGDVEQRVVRVLRRFVRRIVWQWVPGAPTRYAPGTAWYRNGARTAFRAVRIGAGEARLLTTDGIVTVALTKLARIDFPFRDPWDAYFDALPLLSPDLKVDLVQLETTDGLIATSSLSRLRLLPPRHHDAQPQVWRVGLQPAWALDTLWLADTAIVARHQFAPQRVSLTRLEPVETTLAGAVGGGCWPPRKNLNVQGGLLATANKTHAWGFGTQGDTELHFVLHPIVRSFRARVGLDQLAGSGGCARARVFVGSTDGRRLWESPLLVGASQDVDTNTIRLPQSDGDATRLVLQTDSAHDQRPQGADPFDIRDFIDWVNPELELDATELKGQMEDRVASWVPAWKDWTVEIDGGETPLLESVWSDFDSRPSHFRIAARPRNRSLRLSRQVDVSDSASRLEMTVVRPPMIDQQATEIEVLVDDHSIYRDEVPTRGRDHRQLPRIEVPLDEYVGQSVTLTILQHATDAPALLEWLGIDLKAAVDQQPANSRD